jgi:hypothetical protein
LTIIIKMPRLTQFNYVFAIGTFFAMLDAYNNGASERPLSSLALRHVTCATRN